MVHKLRVTDPRQSGLFQITVDGHAIPMQRSGTGPYESDEFVITDAAAGTPGWSISQMKVPVSAGAGSLEVAYNPKKKIPAVKLTDLQPHLRTPAIVNLDKQTQAIGKSLKDDLAANGANSWIKKYPGDPGGYGKEVQAQLNAWAAAHPTFKVQSQVYVNVKTKKVVHIG